MKRLIYLSSFVTVFFISSAILFRFMEWTGLYILGLISSFLVIWTAIILFSNSLTQWRSHSRMHNIRVITGLICALLIADGTIFRLNHLAGGYEQIVAGVILLNLIFLPIFFLELYKKSVESSTQQLD